MEESKKNKKTNRNREKRTKNIKTKYIDKKNENIIVKRPKKRIYKKATRNEGLKK